MEIGMASVIHFRSGESIFRVQQNHRRNAVVIDIVAALAFLLLPLIILPAFGRTGTPWRQPPITVEVFQYLPLILPVALCCGLVISILRRIFHGVLFASRTLHNDS